MTLNDAIRKVLKGFDERVFVRSTTGDDDPAWASKLLPYVQALAVLSAHIDRLPDEPDPDKPPEGDAP